MTVAEAASLVAPAVPAGPGVWADLGAGGGLFTRALAQRLGPDGTVVAVDRDGAALLSIPTQGGAVVRPLVGDIRALDGMAGFPDRLDGALCANVLHFVADARVVLSDLARRLKPGGRIVVVEYDRDDGNRWVPHPISRQALAPLAAASGLGPPEIVGTRPSRFGGEMYCAVLRPA